MTAKPRGILPLAFCVLPIAFISCGYVGDPLPPALNIPQKITDFRTYQRADRIAVEFTVPPLTTEGLGLDLGSIELQAGSWDDSPFDTERWAAGARLLAPACVKAGPCRAEIPSREWTGREVFFRARALSRRGRAGAWSDFAIVRVIAPLATPAGLRAQAVAQGVWVTWEADSGPAGLAFRVRRRTPGEESPPVVVTVPDRGWTDTETEYGKRYEYSVQAVAPAGQSEAEGEWSATVEITPEDRYPPAVPSGVVVVAGAQSAELMWEGNTEPDLRGYRVYRSAGEGPLQPVAGPLDTPGYSDSNVEAGKKYRYAVSAIDRAGNESGLSAPVEIAMP